MTGIGTSNAEWAGMGGRVSVYCWEGQRKGNNGMGGGNGIGKEPDNRFKVRQTRGDKKGRGLGIHAQLS